MRNTSFSSKEKAGEAQHEKRRVRVTRAFIAFERLKQVTYENSDGTLNLVTRAFIAFERFHACPVREGKILTSCRNYFVVQYDRHGRRPHISWSSFVAS
jgi:hypothetical protein